MIRNLTTLLLLAAVEIATVNAMRIIPPPSPFLDAKDLQARYATQVRKLSNAPIVVDGDTYFAGVDTFRPPQELEAGVCADAVNKRFEDGRIWPRNGVNTQAWGTILSLSVAPQAANLCAGLNWPTNPLAGTVYVTVTGFVIGKNYVFSLGNAVQITPTDNNGLAAGPPLPASPAGFKATTKQYVLSGTNSSTAVTTTIYAAGTFNVLGYQRFNDPQGFDTQVVLTDDWRNNSGEDGGRGRCWRIQSGNLPLPVPMNGHDLWGPTRAIPCYNGLVLLRQGNERHYFSAAAVLSNAQIQLNTEPDWVNGDLVQFVASTDSYFTPNPTAGSVPNPDSQYYVKAIGGNKAELYTDAGLTTKLNFNGAVGSFYLMRNASTAGFYGNGAPPLLAQPNALGNTLWDEGFNDVPTAVFVTNVTGNVVTAPNHNLLPADAIAVTGVTVTGGGALPATVYASPTSLHTLQLFDNEDDALAAGATGLIGLTDDSTPGTANIVKAGASGLPMPSGREGCFLENRLVIVNQSCTLGISDPLDALHFTPFTAAVTANLGESDYVQALVPLPLLDSLLILKQNEVLLLNSFSGGSAAWNMTTVTREYGCYAPLSAVQIGSDVWFLSRKGVASITQTVNGITQGVAEPVSKAMKKYIDRIDWRYAAQSVAGYWNNRYYIAVPLKGQKGTPVNNGWLVFNFLNQKWEGLWQGAALAAAGMSRHIVFGDERLTFVQPSGQVCWLGDGFTDGPDQIADRAVTRIYTCGSMSRKLHLAVNMFWDTYRPGITVTAQTPGVNETEILLPNPVTYDSTKYAVAGVADYVPGTSDFQAPFREDYQMTAAELLTGAPDTHQNHTENFRLRLDDWGIQFVIENTQGSCRLQGVNVRAVAGPNMDTAQV